MAASSSITQPRSQGECLYRRESPGCSSEFTHREHPVPDALAGGVTYLGVCNACNNDLANAADEPFVSVFFDLMQTFAPLLGSRHASLRRTVAGPNGITLQAGPGGVLRNLKVQRAVVDGEPVLALPDGMSEVEARRIAEARGLKPLPVRVAAVQDVARTTRRDAGFGVGFVRGLRKALLELADCTSFVGLSTIGTTIARSDGVSGCRRFVHGESNTLPWPRLLRFADVGDKMDTAMGQPDDSDSFRNRALVWWDPADGVVQGVLQVGGTMPLSTTLGTYNASTEVPAKPWCLHYAKALIAGATPVMLEMDTVPIARKDLEWCSMSMATNDALEFGVRQFVGSVGDAMSRARAVLDFSLDGRVAEDLESSLAVGKQDGVQGEALARLALSKFIRTRYQPHDIDSEGWVFVAARIDAVVAGVPEPDAQALVPKARMLLQGCIDRFGYGSAYAVRKATFSDGGRT